MPKFELGEMPESVEAEDKELEGLDYEAPEEEISPVEDLKSKLVDFSIIELDELEAAITEEKENRAEGEDEVEGEEMGEIEETGEEEMDEIL